MKPYWVRNPARPGIILACLVVVLAAGYLVLSARNADQGRSGQKPIISDVIVHEAYSDKFRIGPQWAALYGTGIGFVLPEHRNLPPAQRPQTEEFHLPDGQPFSPILILNTDQPATVLISVLLDYKQIMFELDGQPGLLHEVRVQPGGDWELPFKVNVAGVGAHDLIVVAFLDPYNLSLDLAYRSSSSTRLVGRRAVVIVGDSTQPAKHLDDPMRGVPVPPHVQVNLGVAFAPAAEGPAGHPSERPLYVGAGQANQAFEYQLWISNLDGEQASDYALVGFFDFHQIQLSEKDVLVAYLNPDEELLLTSRIRLPPDQGVHQMQVVYVFDPYRSVVRGQVRAPFVFESPRVALNVKP